MFERYTEKARRVIFFARFEASKFGSPYIETEHLLLGILREDKALTSRMLRPPGSAESIRKQIEAQGPRGEEIPTSADLPLSNESKRVLAYAGEEAERLGHKHIGSEHLLLGLLREEKSFAAALLEERGVKLKNMRKEIESMPPPQPEGRGAFTTGPQAQVPSGPSPIEDFARDLTRAAAEGKLDPVIGREKELNAIIEILCRRFKRSALLIGARGAGKSSLVEALAQEIVGGLAPQPLLDQRVMVMDAEVVSGWALSGPRTDERLHHAVKALIDTTNAIFYISDLERLVAAAVAGSRTAVVQGILKHWLLKGKLVCVAACTPAEHTQLIQAAPWVRECFSEIHVRELDESTTRRVLDSRKQAYEAFHGVTYADEALNTAARSAARYLPDQPLPGKALELLDAAGAHVRSRQRALPAEIAASMKNLNSIRLRIEIAENDHEYEKARFYTEEQQKEQQNLRALQEKHGIRDTVPSNTVTAEDLENIIAQWSAYPFRP